MNEFYVPNVKYTCCGCLKISEDLLTMSVKEITFYKNYIKMDSVNTVLKICYICRFMLYKFQRFVSQSQKAAEFIQSAFEEDNTRCLTSTKPNFDFVSTVSVTHYLGPHLELEIDNHDNDEVFKNDVDTHDDADKYCDEVRNDDDMPLVMFKETTKNEVQVKIKKKKKKTVKNVDNPQATNGKKVQKQLKEGFSSRMVQETEEYEVIKLTKEQVLEETAAKSKSERYLRSLYKCENCAKGFNFKDVLDNHMKKHSQENGTLKCEICTQYCPSAVSLRGHMKSHTTRYKCKICGAVRISRQHLLEHYSIEHTLDASNYTCDHCPFTTKKRTVIQRHVRTHKVGKTLTCSTCGAGFNNMHSLRVHSSRHDPTQRFSCSQCNMKFIYPSLLHRHMRVHSHRDHYCVECDITFKSIDNLKLHFKRAKRHRDPATYKYKCSQCEERFASSPSALAHLAAAHGAARAHACAACGRRYSSREAARAHARRAHAAHAARPRCHLCRKDFSRKYILAKHLRTHSNGNQGCYEEFTQPSMDKKVPQEVVEALPAAKHET